MKLSDILATIPEAAQNARLCYLMNRQMWFTTCPLDKQWGDDWDDAPYEHNSGPPYAWTPRLDVPRYELYVVMFRAGWVKEPDDEYINSPYSVQSINRRGIAWLRGTMWNLLAGTPLRDVVKLAYEHPQDLELFFPLMKWKAE